MPLTRLCYGKLLVSHSRSLHRSATNRIKNYYDTLGLEKSASTADIKTAYYEKAKSYHPDTNKSSNGIKKFQEISEAYEILSDKSKRRAYDSLMTDENISSEYARQKQEQTKSSSSPRSPSIDPLSMNHIRHVYQTLNKEDIEEPKFRPFEDHTYEGTSFNRFEYSRKWDAVNKVWIYQKRKTASEYNRKMAAQTKVVTICIQLVVVSALVASYYSNKW